MGYKVPLQRWLINAEREVVATLEMQGAVTVGDLIRLRSRVQAMIDDFSADDLAAKQRPKATEVAPGYATGIQPASPVDPL